MKHLKIHKFPFRNVIALAIECNVHLKIQQKLRCLGCISKQTMRSAVKKTRLNSSKDDFLMKTFPSSAKRKLSIAHINRVKIFMHNVCIGLCENLTVFFFFIKDQDQMEGMNSQFIKLGQLFEIQIDYFASQRFLFQNFSLFIMIQLHVVASGINYCHFFVESCKCFTVQVQDQQVHTNTLP